MLTCEYSARCDLCGRTAKVMEASTSGEVKLLLRAHGWRFFGGSAQQDCCPSCSKGRERKAGPYVHDVG
jgi:hypothetical protein